MWKTLRRATTGWLIRLADYLSSDPAEPDAPTLAELTPLSFDEVWHRLIDAVRACGVCQVDLAVYRQNDRASDYSWTEPDAEGLDHCRWSLGVAFPRADGRRCELQAATYGGTTPDPLVMFALTRMLNVFAMRFAIQVDRPAGLTVLRAEEEAALPLVEYLEKAA